MKALWQALVNRLRGLPTEPISPSTPSSQESMTMSEPTIPQDVASPADPLLYYPSPWHHPLEGECVSLAEVPDPVFSSGAMGNGYAIKPSNNRLCSPVDGRIISLFPTKHAIGIESAHGQEILIHVGVDTVRLKGEGFTTLVNEGDTVRAGQPLLDIDFATIASKVPSIITIIIFPT